MIWIVNRLSLAASGLALQALLQHTFGHVLAGREWTVDDALGTICGNRTSNHPASDLAYCCKNLRNAAVHEELTGSEGVAFARC